MSTARLSVYSGGLQRQATIGDVLLTGVLAAAITTAGAATLTAGAVLGGVIRRSGPAAGFTDTWPTAEQICAALRGHGNNADHVPGLGVSLRYINTVAQANTMAVPANEGISLSTAVYSSVVNCAASSYRDYFIELVSAPVPAISVAGTTANGTKKLVLNAEASPGSIVPGMSVYGTGVGASAKVTHVIYGAAGVKEVWVDVNSTADGSNITISLKPTVVVHSTGSGTL
jgi:hypothetical protein